MCWTTINQRNANTMHCCPHLAAHSMLHHEPFAYSRFHRFSTRCIPHRCATLSLGVEPVRARRRACARDPKSPLHVQYYCACENSEPRARRSCIITLAYQEYPCHPSYCGTGARADNGHIEILAPTPSQLSGGKWRENNPHY
jgi:hypothetical protein